MDTIEDKVVSFLKEKNMTVTTAESCTAGLLAGQIMNVSGASAVFGEGYITYANVAKEKLVGVSHDTLVRFGAVSEETACEMAIGAARAAGTDAALSVTGIAGPTGGSDKKPVGLVYIGCCVCGKVVVKEYHFNGSRNENRKAAAQEALQLLFEKLKEI